MWRAVLGCGIAGVVAAGLLATPHGTLAAACDTSWTGGNGDWSQTVHWTNGVPTSATNACLPVGAYTVSIAGESVQAATLTIGANVTLSLQITGCGPVSAVLTMAGNLTNAGTLALENPTDACGGTARVIIPSGSTLTNTGTILTSGGRGDRQLTGSVTNQGTINVNLIPAGVLHLDGAGLFDNQGALTIADGMVVRVPGGTGLEFRNDVGGSIAGSGTSGQLIVDSGNTFTEGAGTTTGNAILLTGGGTLRFTGAGASAFNLRGDGGANTLSGGPTAAGQTVNVQIHGCVGLASSVVNLAGNLTNGGTINLGNLDDGCGGTARVIIPSGSTLTNTGTILTSGGRGDRQLTGSVTNQGTINVNPVTAGVLHLDGAGLFDNQGVVTIADGMMLRVPGGTGLEFRNDAGGSIAGNGTTGQLIIDSGNTFTEGAGTTTGNPVLFPGGGTLHFTGAGASTFNLRGDTGANTLSGAAIAAGQTVNVQIHGCGAVSSVANLAGSLTNAGTINLGNLDDGCGGTAQLVIPGGATLTNTGTMLTSGGRGDRQLTGSVTNRGTISVNPSSGQFLHLDGAGLFDNFGSVSVAAGMTLVNTNDQLIAEPGGMLGGAGSYTLGSAGTLGVTIDAGLNSYTGISCGGSTGVAGALRVRTVGAPAAGTNWPIIVCGSRAGSFASQDFAGRNYTIQYPAAGVTLVAQASCDVWIGSDGNFNTATNWSYGTVPGSADDACITATTTTIPPANADTYTVVVNGDFPVHSLMVGGASGTQTVNIPSSRRLTLLATSSIAAHGVMVLGDAGNGDAWLGCVPACSPTGPTLTNNGMVKTVQGGGGIRHIQPIVINAAGATLDVAGTAVQTDGGCNNPGGISKNQAIINNGSVIVEATGSFSPDCGFVNAAGATVVNNGILTPAGAFVQRGTESGNPVFFMNGSGIDDDLSAGPGSFVYSGSVGYPQGQNSLGGTGPNPGIPAGQVITIASTNTYIGIYPNITNAGTIILGDNSGTGDSALCCAYFTSGATITNSGTIRTVPGSGGIRHLQVNVANVAGGMIDIGADTRQDQACGNGGVNATTISNSGTFTLEASGKYAMSTCAAGGYQNTFTQSGVGAFQATIDANATKFGSLTGGLVNLDGLLKVTTVGTPAIGSNWPIVSGATRVGQFPTRDLGTSNYDVRYPSGGVTLVARALARPYHPLPPKRILDTRPSSQVGPFGTPFGPDASRDVTIAGMGGVPATGASAVVLNVTVTDTTAGSYLTLYPTGVGRPLASNLNWVAGNTTPNLVEVALGTAGQVSIYNAFGTVDVVIDVAGFVSTPGVTNVPDGLFTPVVPVRLLDTRYGTGAPQAPVSGNHSIDVQVTGVAGTNVPATGVSAVVLNVTVTNATAGSYLTVFPTGGGQPLASNLNFVAGQTVPNRVIVKVGATGQVSFYNAFGTVDVIADVGGWYTDATLGGNGTTFTGITPARIYDTRSPGLTPLGPNGSRPVPAAGVMGIPPMTDATPPTALVLNVTVVNPTAGSYLTVWPDGAGRPLASDLNFVAGQTVPNLVVVQIGADGSIALYNAFGSTDIVIDVVGYYS